MSKPALVDTYARFPFSIAEGHGSRVRDTSGREYWDLYGGHAVALLGHAHPAVTQAIAEQAGRLTFYSNVAPLDIRTQAAERLREFAPPELGHVFFCNSGAEANENALKLAIQQTGRQRIAALRGAFHGRTLLALAATDSDPLRGPFAAQLCPTLRLSPGSLGELVAIDSSIAAVIVEPIQSMAGVVVLSPDFLQALRRRCDDVGAWLIYDEVQTGMGRLGRPFAAGEHGIVPDVVTLAKGIANGIPMGALLMTADVAERIQTGDLGTTFGGGPVPCAALLAVLATIHRERLVEHAAKLGELARNVLGDGPVQDVLGRGCLLGLRLNVEAKTVQQALFDQGFITATSGDPHVLRLLPPLNTPPEAIEELGQALKRL